MTTRPPVLNISVPLNWARRADPTRGVLVAARSPVVPASGFRPEIVARYVIDPGTDLGRWRVDALGALADALVDFALEDDDEFDLLGHPVAYARFAHRCLTTEVVCEQWSWLADGVGITLTCSVSREDYADYCDLFDAIAESVELETAAA